MEWATFVFIVLFLDTNDIEQMAKCHKTVEFCLKELFCPFFQCNCCNIKKCVLCVLTFEIVCPIYTLSYILLILNAVVHAV